MTLKQLRKHLSTFIAHRNARPFFSDGDPLRKKTVYCEDFRDWLLAAIFWLALCDRSAARIGETVDQVLKRYGRCLKTVTTDNGMVYKLFSKSGFRILVHLHESKVDEISYGKDTDTTDEEMKALMQDNAPGEWIGVGWPSYTWHTER
jgi:hypothetical protein